MNAIDNTIGLTKYKDITRCCQIDNSIEYWKGKQGSGVDTVSACIIDDNGGFVQYALLDGINSSVAGYCRIDTLVR